MSDFSTHALGAGLGVGLVHFAHERSAELQPTGAPFLSAALAACAGSIPDILEPPIHPNHRQFFHSIVAGALVVYGASRIFTWEPESEFQKLVRYLALVGAGAYIVHLLLDSSTKKSLPLVGRF